MSETTEATLIAFEAASQERAAIVKHIHNVGDTLARLGRVNEARGMHMLAMAIEKGAHHGLSRDELVEAIGEQLQTIMPARES